VTRAVVDPYRRPKCVKGFEAGIVRFLRSRAAPSGALGAYADALRAAVAAERPLSPLERLCAAGVPILIVHGEQDALVPLSNSRRLAGALSSVKRTEREFSGRQPELPWALGVLRSAPRRGTLLR
jgi:pimeloyl-ACP methyl ester carboxylesterase